jgi:pyruvate/2-oxoglutarate dehydrogenase complex dihydrolipoamide dehydrogenase (E3) component
MPTKTLLRSSDVLSLIRRAAEFGLKPANAQADLSAIIDRKNRLIQEFAEYRIDQLKNPRFTLYEEAASFLSPHEIRVGEKTLRAKNFIIATGSNIADFPIPGLQESGAITSDDTMNLRVAPKSMIVLGGGPVAVELAQFYSRIGVQVSLIQRSGHILSAGDEDLARSVEQRLRDEGMQVYTGTQLVKVTGDGKTRTVHFKHEGQEKTVTAEVVLQALGRRPNIDRLDLGAAKVVTENSGVKVDAEMRTSQPHIFAVGDVNGIQEIVHIAIEQGEVAGYNAVHPDQPAKKWDDRLKTSVVFTDPAIASVGLSEKECQVQGVAYHAASHPFADHGKSMCLGETHGHVKLLCQPVSGEVIGGHIVGPEAGELIHQIITLMHFQGTVHDLLRMPHYHPTLSEIITYPAEELIEKLDAEKS